MPSLPADATPELIEGELGRLPEKTSLELFDIFREPVHGCIGELGRQLVPWEHVHWTTREALWEWRRREFLPARLPAHHGSVQYGSIMRLAGREDQ